MHPSPENGLSGISVALVFQIRAIDSKRILRKIGDLESDILKKIGEMIKEMLYL
ncbi:MAG TPA: hypothetical protein DCQ37_03275 [Desulfobacteraceae bacterium]|nr:hypothetical protein [Desulfobacteraceae bacterium]